MTKRTITQNLAGEFVRYPFIHSLAFEFAQKGYRGSSYAWRVAKRLKNPKIGRNTKLPSGFVLDEIGIAKRSPVLKVISCTEALRFTSQWNLVLMRKEVFAKYQEKTDAIAIESNVEN